MTRTAIGMLISLVALATPPAAAESESAVVRLEGTIASITPFGDVRLKEKGDRNERAEERAARDEPESDRHERKLMRRSSCMLSTGTVLACATRPQDTDPEPSCRPIDESRCDFAVELPLAEQAGVVGFFFVQDENGDGAAGEGERVAELIAPEDGAPVCAGDVMRIEDVAVDFAEAAPNAAAIHKLEDACAAS